MPKTTKCSKLQGEQHEDNGEEPHSRKRKNARHRCIICQNNAISESYFNFPTQKELKENWMKFFNLSSTVLSNNARVCSKHFNEEDYSIHIKGNTTIRKLKANATPSVVVSSQELVRKAKWHRCFLCGENTGDRCYFRFPSKNSNIFKKWIEFCGTAAETILPSHQLCSIHFTSDVIVGSTAFGKQRTLKQDAVPTIKYNDQVLDEGVDLTKNILPEESNNEIIIAEVDPHIVNAVEVDSTNLMNICDTDDVENDNTRKSDDSRNYEQTESHCAYTTPSTPTSHAFAYNYEQTENQRENTTSSTPTSHIINAEFKIPQYIGRIRTPHLSSPRRAKLCFALAKRVICKKNSEIKLLQQTVFRLRRRIKTVKGLLSHLKRKCLISESARVKLLESMPKYLQNLIMRAEGPKKAKYSPELRTFALTLKFYSTKAYNYVRKVWGKLLPAPSTIKKWYAVVDASPGFTAESFNAIRLRAANEESRLPVNLVMDEVGIRQQLVFQQNKQYGHVNLGTNRLEEEGDDNAPLAKNALVFMAVSLKQGWKVPIGYFLIDGLSADERANLVTMALDLLHDAKADVYSITFDGAGVNLDTMKILGANFNYLSTTFKPFILHPITKETIYVILDPSHMIKLARNTLGETHYLVDGNGRRIRWSDICSLLCLEEREGLKLATKITKKHVNYTDNVMKVSLAAQTLSESVACALKFAQNENIQEFKDCTGTANYCQVFNDMFDILNCRSKFSYKPYNIPIMDSNLDFLQKEAEKGKQYIANLKICIERKRKDKDGKINVSYIEKPILLSQRKTGFLGFIISLENIFNIYKSLKRRTGQEYLLSYKLSQDHLESFFGSLRSKGGHNNNPNAYQFENSYKQLLVHNEVQCSERSNIKSDDVEILHVSSSIKNTTEATPSTSHTTNNDSAEETNSAPRDEEDEMDSIIEEIEYGVEKEVEPRVNDVRETSTQLTTYVQEVVVYVSGFVSRSVKRRTPCPICQQLLVGDRANTGNFLTLKDRGKLTVPSEDTIILCMTMEAILRKNPTNNFTEKYRANIIKMCRESVKNLVFNEPQPHDIEHLHKLIDKILEKYYEIRVHHILKMKSIKSRYCRRRLTKFILFQRE